MSHAVGQQLQCRTRANQIDQDSQCFGTQNILKQQEIMPVKCGQSHRFSNFIHLIKPTAGLPASGCEIVEFPEITHPQLVFHVSAWLLCSQTLTSNIVSIQPRYTLENMSLLLWLAINKIYPISLNPKIRTHSRNCQPSLQIYYIWLNVACMKTNIRTIRLSNTSHGLIHSLYISSAILVICSI